MPTATQIGDQHDHCGLLPVQLTKDNVLSELHDRLSGRARRRLLAILAVGKRG